MYRVAGLWAAKNVPTMDSTPILVTTLQHDVLSIGTPDNMAANLVADFLKSSLS
jgi:hypothetical protein